MESEKRKPPVKTFRLAQIKASIWANRNQSGSYYSVTIVRSYTDQDGRWQDTSSFMQHHIPLVLKVLEHAYAYIHELQGQNVNGEECGDPVPFDIPEGAGAYHVPA